MIRIKICGITDQKDADAAVRFGADMLGFVFYKGSKRYIDPSIAQGVIKNIPARIKKVGVFFNETVAGVEKVAECAGIDTIQLHGEESSGVCAGLAERYSVIKAFRIKTENDLLSVGEYEKADYYLFDAFCGENVGGTGKTFDWKYLKGKKFAKPVIISGGLTPSNVGAAIVMCAPFGVDVSSGVEVSPGKKDAVLVKQFIDAVRRS